jgi:hypothetical protein
MLDLLAGQYKSGSRGRPQYREQWSQDVSSDVAHELPRGCDRKQLDFLRFVDSMKTIHTACAADPRGLTMAFQRRKLKAIDFKAPYPGSSWPFATAVHVPTAALIG